ncbi:MAG: 50S ribosomal protein L25 [Actinomycetes bacterium]|jgi:large subunit ribosomal protein L25
MSQVTLSALSERVQGSRNVRRLRIAGSIPGVVYGQGVTPVPVSVDAKEFRTSVSGELGLNTVINLETPVGKFTCMAREIQRHPVRGTVQHIDFQVIDTKAGVKVEVPIHVVGDAVEVRHADYEVNQMAFSVVVNAMPDKIPSFITVDISDLKVGDTIRVGDLTLPEGVVANDATVGLVGTRAGRAAKTAGNAAAVAE